MNNSYGKELILDLHNCNVNKFTRQIIESFFIELCKKIDMQRADLHWWDDLDLPEDERENEPHLKGTSAIQFITTSNITIHTLDMLKSVYLNIFSCKDFDPTIAMEFSKNWFEGEIVSSQIVVRK